MWGAGGGGRPQGVCQAEPQPLTRMPARPCLSQSVMLQIAASELEKEESRRESEKQNYLAENCPPLHIPGSMAEVQVPRAPSRAPAGCLSAPTGQEGS